MVINNNSMGEIVGNTHLLITPETKSQTNRETKFRSMDILESNLIKNKEQDNILIKEEITFEEKLQTLRNHLMVMKVDWRDAHCRMELNREHVLNESMKQFATIDPYKELKISFKGEVSYDAGGIIREWFTVLLKELQSADKSIKRL